MVSAWIGYLGIHSYRIRRRITRILERNEFEEPTLTAINERLMTLNEKSRGEFFVANRRANISFRGERISLVYGCVVNSAFCMSRSDSFNRLFAIADSQQAEWMKKNSDVFKPALMSSQFSIFGAAPFALEK